MDDDLGISTESFIRLGIYLCKTQKTIDETNCEEQKILNEEQEILNEEQEILNKEQEILNKEQEILNEEQEILNEEQEILNDTIIELKQKRHEIIYKINQLLIENTDLTNKINVFDYENKLQRARKTISNSSYNIIYLQSKNIKHLIIEYLNKQTKNNILINEHNSSLDAVDESIAYFESKIIYKKCY